MQASSGIQWFELPGNAIFTGGRCGKAGALARISSAADHKFELGLQLVAKQSAKLLSRARTTHHTNFKLKLHIA